MFKKLNLEMKFTIVSVILIGVLIGITAIIYNQINFLGAMNHKLLEEDLSRLSLSKDIMSLARDNSVATSEYFIVTDKSKYPLITERIQKNRKRITEYLDKLDILITDSDTRSILKRIQSERKEYVATFEAIRNLLVDKDKLKEATDLYNSQLISKLNVFMDSIEDLISALNSANLESQKKNSEYIQQTKTVLLALNSGLVLSLFIGWFFVRRVIREMELSNIENLKFRVALECASTNIMMADNDRKVTYMNRSIKKMFSDAESDIKKQIPMIKKKTG